MSKLQSAKLPQSLREARSATKQSIPNIVKEKWIATASLKLRNDITFSSLKSK
jgi:hypothetical protein